MAALKKPQQGPMNQFPKNRAAREWLSGFFAAKHKTAV